jgi:catechol 2,3-dioxygenase-like lactoylglutathione lyase family enzyme
MPASGGNEMSVVGIDHASFPTLQPEEMIAFYKRLGFEIVGEEEWRSGKRPVFWVQAGHSKLSIHGPALYSDPNFTLRGPTAKPGCADVCFEWAGSIESAVALIRNAGAEIVEGPVPRSGGRTGHAMHVMNASSVYTRDPDGNLLEFLTYRP